MTKSLLTIAIVFVATANSFAAATVSVDDLTVTLTPAPAASDTELSLTPLPASTLMDNTLADCGCDIERPTAKVRVNIHNLLLRDSRLVDMVESIA